MRFADARSRLLTLLLIAAAAYLAAVALAFWGADRIMFPAPPATYDADELALIRVRTDDGVDLAALRLENATARRTLIYSHGNGEDLGMIAPRLEALRDFGFDVVAYDYRGYGASGGRATADGVQRDLDAVYAYVRDTLRIPPERIVLYGYSVGSGPAVQLAAREPVAGLIVENGFVTAFRVVTRVPILPFDRFASGIAITQVRCPVLIIHATRDRVVPFSHGRKLFELAREPKRSLWVEGAGHGDIMEAAGERYWRELRWFL